MNDQDTASYRIDASKFLVPLQRLAETLAQKLQREVPTLISAPTFVSIDLFVMMRQAMYTFNLLCFVNADDRRENDSNWNPAYTFVTLPLIRSMIDILYNITFILLAPAENGKAFRLAGYKKELSDLKEDKDRYGGRTDWDPYLKSKGELLSQGLRADGFTIAAALSAKSWMTLGKYVSDKQAGGTLNDHQAFLKTFTHGMWREYSAMAHGGFEGLMDTAVYFARDAQRHELRPKLDEAFPRILSLHMMRASLLILCLISELQLRFRFPDANINGRLLEIWDVLMPAYEANELYQEHYRALLEERQIKR